jgi:aspartate carbamoyltransferase regulatory subunit
MAKELRVRPISNGTVIDHIPAGMALKVLSILGLDEKVNTTVSVLMFVRGKQQKRKDVVKVEGKALNPKEVNKIALIAPVATINIIMDSEVVNKYQVKLADNISGIVNCSNPSCISNSKEPIEPEFKVLARDPPQLVCKYCERELHDIYKHII